MSTPGRDDAKWKQIVLQSNREPPSPTLRALAVELRIAPNEMSFTHAFTDRFPATTNLGWVESWDMAAEELGIDIFEEVQTGEITRFLDEEGYTRLEGESVAARAIRIIQEAEQRAAAGKIVNGGE